MAHSPEQQLVKARHGHNLRKKNFPANLAEVIAAAKQSCRGWRIKKIGARWLTKGYCAEQAVSLWPAFLAHMLEKFGICTLNHTVQDQVTADYGNIDIVIAQIPKQNKIQSPRASHHDTIASLQSTDLRSNT